MVSWRTAAALGARGVLAQGRRAHLEGRLAHRRRFADGPAFAPRFDSVGGGEGVPVDLATGPVAETARLAQGIPAARAAGNERRAILGRRWRTLALGLRSQPAPATTWRVRA